MGPQLQSIKVHAKPMRKAVRGIPETRGTRCHGCPDFECIPTSKRTKPWRFWCERRHREIVPGREECRTEEAQPRRPRAETFAHWLTRRLREEHMTQAALAKLVQAKTGDRMSVQTISNYKRGACVPPTPQRNRICSVLGPYTGGGA